MGSCILGPDASVSGGECSRSILGPSIGFHHSSLLIATIWPFGRGNIAYGAMVGANHTGRLNDQECFPGEGTFFGLGSSVKFPFNSLDSPYSMVAPGTVCLSQRIRFPFSLLSTQDFSINGSSRSMNSLKPGWVLTHNPYFLDRSAAKFRSRGKARHHCTTFSVLRPSIVNLMLDAVRRLQAVSGKDNYDEGDIPGLGKCLMLEKDRLSAIAVYVNYCRRYALQSLLSLEKGEFDATFGAFESQKSHQSPSEVKSSLTLLQLDLDLFAINNDEIKQSEMRGHQRSLLLGLLDSGNTPSLEPLLYELLDLETQHANAVLACRKKDERGASIIEDYKDVHIKAEEDPVVIAAFENLTFIKRRVETLLACDP